VRLREAALNQGRSHSPRASVAGVAGGEGTRVPHGGQPRSLASASAFAGVLYSPRRSGGFRRRSRSTTKAPSITEASPAQRPPVGDPCALALPAVVQDAGRVRIGGVRGNGALETRARSEAGVRRGRPITATRLAFSSDASVSSRLPSRPPGAPRPGPGAGRHRHPSPGRPGSTHPRKEIPPTKSSLIVGVDPSQNRCRVPARLRATLAKPTQFPRTSPIPTLPGVHHQGPRARAYGSPTGGL